MKKKLAKNIVKLWNTFAVMPIEKAKKEVEKLPSWALIALAIAASKSSQNK